MADCNSVLTIKRVVDLVAYLASLKKKENNGH